MKVARLARYSARQEKNRRSRVAVSMGASSGKKCPHGMA
jgi:hypothetical protein